MIEIVLVRKSIDLALVGVGPGFEIRVDELPRISMPEKFESMRAILSGEIPLEVLEDTIVPIVVNDLIRAVKAAQSLEQKHEEAMLDEISNNCGQLLAERIQKEAGLAVGVKVKTTTISTEPAEPTRTMVRATMSRGSNGTILSGAVGEVMFNIKETLPYNMPSNVDSLILTMEEDELIARYSTQEKQTALSSVITDAVFETLDAIDTLSGNPADDSILIKLLGGYSKVISQNIHTHSKLMDVHTNSHPIVVAEWWIKRIGSERYEFFWPK